MQSTRKPGNIIQGCSGEDAGAAGAQVFAAAPVAAKGLPLAGSNGASPACAGPEDSSSDQKAAYPINPAYRQVEQLKQITGPLLAWFEGHARDLPWRRDPSPYHVWVSEIMLQQTRVEAVKPYYARFLTELPDIRSLAECSQDRLLKLWEGLGYYSRVRNMQKAAQIVCDQYNGELPSDYDMLLKLPGIGSYTAGAIASIAYGLPVPAVDGNVLRVVSRICADDGEITSQKVKRQWESVLRQVIPSDSPKTPGKFNQAMMELGATVCLPNGYPSCQACPVRAFCTACIRGNVMDYPVKKSAKNRREEQRTVFVIRQDGCYLLHRRPENGLLAGLYEFPNTEGFLTRMQAYDWFAEKGWQVLRMEEISGARHIFSHVEWHMHGYLVEISGPGNYDGPNDSAGRPESYLPAGLDQINREYSIPSAFAVYMNYIRSLEQKPEAFIDSYVE